MCLLVANVFVVRWLSERPEIIGLKQAHGTLSTTRNKNRKTSSTPSGSWPAFAGLERKKPAVLSSSLIDWNV